VKWLAGEIRTIKAADSVAPVSDAAGVFLAITIEHHDAAYVDRRGGFALLSHLRGAPARVEHRRASIQRAFDAFDAAEQVGKADAEIGGLGLLVLQRALLATEDLGGLLYAFAGSDPWQRLRTAKIPELDAAYLRATEDLEGTLHDAFRLVSDDYIDGLSDPEEQGVLRQLRVRTVTRWAGMLSRSAWLWSSCRNVAKATMHGFPIVAGSHLEGPPRAGELADDVRPPGRRYAVAVTSTASGTQVTTDRTIIGLSRKDVLGYHRNGRTAARLMGELCEMHGQTIMSGHGAMMPLRSVPHLDRRSQAIAQRLLDRTKESA
jgi:hypothetical protein